MSSLKGGSALEIDLFSRRILSERKVALVDQASYVSAPLSRQAKAW